MFALPVLSGSPPREPASVASEAPRPWFHLLPGDAPLVFLVEGSRLFQVEAAFFAALEAGEPSALAELREAATTAQPALLPQVSANTAPHALSLALAQACNLSCSYCYADEGRFGGRARMMSREVALAAIDRLVDGATGPRVTVGFIGGEVLLNREVLYASVEHARRRVTERGLTVGFSLTTNGTLLEARDVALLREQGFAVSVSMDGGARVHDRHRPDHRGAGSHASALRALAPLLENPGRARVTARATVTRDDPRVHERVEELIAAGFHEVGVSPLRTGPDASLTLRPEDWNRFLEEMVRAGEAEWRRLLAGEPQRFSNLAIALKEIHQGAYRPLPCGAAAGYVSVGAEGGYFTCHRTVDDARFALGDVTSGYSQDARERFLRLRHVDRQEPCRSCWARYLCGGGCHAEVIAAGREGCDYIRGWLEFCLRLYDQALSRRPTLFSQEPARS